MTTLLIWWSTPLLALSLLRNRLTKGLVVIQAPCSSFKDAMLFLWKRINWAVSLHSFQSFKWMKHELGDPVTQLNLFSEAVRTKRWTVRHRHSSCIKAISLLRKLWSVLSSYNRWGIEPWIPVKCCFSYSHVIFTWSDALYYITHNHMSPC